MENHANASKNVRWSLRQGQAYGLVLSLRPYGGPAVHCAARIALQLLQETILRLVGLEHAYEGRHALNVKPLRPRSPSSIQKLAQFISFHLKLMSCASTSSARSSEAWAEPLFWLMKPLLLVELLHDLPDIASKRALRRLGMLQVQQVHQFLRELPGIS